MQQHENIIHPTHLGTNDITNQVENDPDATSCSKRNRTNDNEREKYNDSSSSVLFFYIFLSINIFSRVLSRKRRRVIILFYHN